MSLHQGDSIAGLSRTDGQCAESLVFVGMMFDDKGRSSLVGERGPDPLDKDAESKACLGKKLNMNKSPYKPRQQAAKADLPALQDSEAFADNRKVSFIEIAKGLFEWLAGDAISDHVRCILSLLHSNLRDSGQRLAILVLGSGITDDKDFRVILDGEIDADANASGAVCLRL
jgi:hypothetical protein